MSFDLIGFAASGAVERHDQTQLLLTSIVTLIGAVIHYLSNSGHRDWLLT